MSWRWLVATVAALAAAIVVLLLALDIGHWESTLARDDVRFEAVPTRPDLWQPDELVAFHAGRRLLGIDEDLEYRRTLRSFWLASPDKNPFLQKNSDLIRSRALVSLANFIRTSHVPRRRAQAANLLGVMGLGLATTDNQGQRLRFLLYSARAFRGALTVDPKNEDAKFNLELTLRLLQRLPTGTGGGSAQGFGRSGGAALAKPGSGY
jgi:hypothetical protein